MNTLKRILVAVLVFLLFSSFFSALLGALFGLVGGDEMLNRCFYSGIKVSAVFGALISLAVLFRRSDTSLFDNLE